MIRTEKFLSAAMVLACLSLFAPHMVAAQEYLDLEPAITVKGQAVVAHPPDQAEITLGVESRAATAKEAAKKNASAMARVLEAVKAQLGQGDRLSTRTYRVSPRYQWDPKDKVNKLKGFEAVNRVSLTTGRKRDLGTILDAAVGAGANTISGPLWSLKDPAAARREAQVKAFLDAQAQAKALAQAAGMNLGIVVKIQTTATGGRPPEVLRMKAANAGTPMEPGLVEISAQVTCTFLLEPRQ